MRIALAQLNPIIGDVAGNTALVMDAIRQARRDRAEVLVTSELVLIGYPPRDLLLREGVVESCEQAVRQIAAQAGDMYVIVGHPRKGAGGVRPLRNSASVCHRGAIIAVCDKQLLPGYDVFDEDRYFEPGGRSLVVPMNDRRVGLLICEDLWRARDVTAQRRYPIEPVAECIAQDSEIIISLNASPFVVGKWDTHLRQLAEIAVDYHVPVIAVNQVGGNDDLVFDGRSVLMWKDGTLAATLPGFESCVRTVDLSDLKQPHKARGLLSPGPVSLGRSQGQESLGFGGQESLGFEWADPLCEIYYALVLGLRDYCRKTGHSQVLIGLSGGIDSALTAVLASAAIGPGNVHGVLMPSIFSSPGSISDSLDVAQRLGLASCREVPIKAVHQAMRQTLSAPIGPECATGVTDENVQARLRGVILMAMSNTGGALLASTSNKSEIATGYSTLYGDMCGAFAVLGDLTKTRIYALARWINTNHLACGFARPPIPENSLTKPPSAELRANQTDQDTLPPYELLDQIIERCIEWEQSEQTIIDETGFDPALVRKTLKMIDLPQYKRDQAPVIFKVTGRAFGRGRPMPIVMKQTAAGEQEQKSEGRGQKSEVRDQRSEVRSQGADGASAGVPPVSPIPAEPLLVNPVRGKADR